MKALQAERRAVLYNSCQRSNSNFRDFSDKPHLSALYSDKYKVPRSDNSSQCCGRCRTFRKSVEFGNIFSINFSFLLHEWWSHNYKLFWHFSRLTPMFCGDDWMKEFWGLLNWKNWFYMKGKLNGSFDGPWNIRLSFFCSIKWLQITNKLG